MFGSDEIFRVYEGMKDIQTKEGGCDQGQRQFSFAA